MMKYGKEIQEVHPKYSLVCKDHKSGGCSSSVQEVVDMHFGPT